MQNKSAPRLRICHFSVNCAGLLIRKCERTNLQPSTYFADTRCAFDGGRNRQTRRKNITLFFVQESQTPLHLPHSQPIRYTSSLHSTYTMAPIKNNKNVPPKPRVLTRRAKGRRVSLDPRDYQSWKRSHKSDMYVKKKNQGKGSKQSSCLSKCDGVFNSST
ncbi:MAG: hypothetical protein J3R72DRAFT_436159 [Linnemannia gamsii]|nr:MAG: hypothetical protein J3R72DRAFT_436159 [Linnemannia gamsii]